MSKRFVIGVALVTALALPVYVRAHEGHARKVIGTVATRHENHLEVKATDGKTAMVTLNKDTKILRGKVHVIADDIKPGERIVVAATETKDKDGKATTVATEIRLGPADSK